MRRIANHRLWIGNVIDVADLRSIHDLEIEALVDLGLNEPIPAITRELVYLRFPLIDGAGNRQEVLRLAVETTARLIVAAVPTLIFCSAGMSRSPAVASAAIALATGRSPNECLSEVFAVGPGDLSPPLWHDLIRTVEECSRTPPIADEASR